MHVIEVEFLKKNYFFNNQILKHLALHAWNLADPEDKLKPEFHASDGWCLEFRHRQHYVWRKAHLKRRPTYDAKLQDLLTAFTTTVENLKKAHAEAGTSYLLANMDETSWKIAYPGIMTWAQKGAEDVRINLNYNSKESITAIATITNDPKHYKIPLAIIAKGTTDRCLKQLGEHHDHEYWLLHSKSGWSNTTVMEAYLQKLREYYDTTFANDTNYKVHDSAIDLIWDCFAAHRNIEIREIAKRLNINLHFVPAGGTGDYQPLDVRVFGALKAIAKNEWYSRYTLNRDSPQNKASAVEILLMSWEKIDGAVINAAWDIFSSETKKAEKEMALTPRDVLPCYKGIISILSHPKYITKYKSIKEFVSRHIKEDEDSSDEENEKSEEEDVSWSESSEDDDDPPISPPSESTYEEEDIIRRKRTDIEQKIDESLRLLDPSSFSPGTPESAAQLLAEEQTRILHRFDPEVFNQDKTIPRYPEVVGIRNFGRNCFFNAALQILKAIPNVIQYIAPRGTLPRVHRKKLEWITSAKNYNDFIDFTANALLDMDNVKHVFYPDNLRAIPYFGESSSCAIILHDFLISDPRIGLIHKGAERKMVAIPIGKTFAQVLEDHEGDATGNILFFTLSRFLSRNNDIEKPFPLHFPLMFTHSNLMEKKPHEPEEIFLLKAVVCHYSDHYVTYIRRSFTDHFLEINDQNVREKEIEHNFTHLALYLKCP
jgi:hypothetical protein